MTAVWRKITNHVDDCYLYYEYYWLEPKESQQVDISLFTPLTYALFPTLIKYQFLYSIRYDSSHGMSSTSVICFVIKLKVSTVFRGYQQRARLKISNILK